MYLQEQRPFQPACALHTASQSLPIAQVCARGLDNRELDKLVGALGRSKATWRRALLLHEWLLGMGHTPDDRLCTTLMRVCAQHGQVQQPCPPGLSRVLIPLRRLLCP